MHAFSRVRPELTPATREYARRRWTRESRKLLEKLLEVIREYGAVLLARVDLAMASIDDYEVLNVDAK